MRLAEGAVYDGQRLLPEPAQLSYFGRVYGSVSTIETNACVAGLIGANLHRVEWFLTTIGFVPCVCPEVGRDSHAWVAQEHPEAQVMRCPPVAQPLLGQHSSAHQCG